MLEIQMMTDSMNKLGVSKSTAEDLKTIINDRSNLRTVSRTENLRTGAEIRHYRETGEVGGTRAIEKQLKGVQKIKDDWDLARYTRLHQRCRARPESTTACRS